MSHMLVIKNCLCRALQTNKGEVRWALHTTCGRELEGEGQGPGAQLSPWPVFGAYGGGGGGKERSFPSVDPFMPTTPSDEADAVIAVLLQRGKLRQEEGSHWPGVIKTGYQETWDPGPRAQG